MYFRVMQPGTVLPAASLELVASSADAPSFAAATTLWATHRPTLAAFRQLAATPGIATHWRRKIVDRLGWLEKLGDEAAPPPALHVKPEAGQ